MQKSSPNPSNPESTTSHHRKKNLETRPPPTSPPRRVVPANRADANRNSSPLVRPRFVPLPSMPTSVTAANAPLFDPPDGELKTLSSALDAALRLPRSYPLVASWLFPDDTETPFADSSTLSPSSFETSLTARSESTFTPFKHTSPSIASAPPCDNDYVIFIPLQVDDQFTLGFTFHVGLPTAESLFPIADILRSKFAFVGRFAFHRVERQLLIYIKDFSDNTSLLGACERLSSNDRSVHFVSIPKRSFSYSDLPSEAIGATVICQPEEYPAPPWSVSSGPNSHNESNQLQSPGNSNSNNRSVEEDRVTPVQETAPRTRTEAKAESALIETSHSLGRPAGGLDPVAVRDCMADLRSVFCGQFPPRKITRDLPSTPDLSCPVVVGLLSFTTRLGVREEAELLQKLAARTYYAAVLSVSSDMRLVMGAEEQQERNEIKEEGDGERR